MAKVLNGAAAIIKVQGQVVGYMKDVRISESITRQEIRGIGTLLPSEASATQWRGTLSCSFFFLDFRKSGLPGAIRRDVGIGNAASTVANTTGVGTSNFEDNILLDEIGVQVDVYKKITDVSSPDPNTGLIIPTKEPLCTVTRLFIESESINISEGTISGQDQSFIYLDPIVYNP